MCIALGLLFLSKELLADSQELWGAHKDGKKMLQSARILTFYF